MSQRQRRRRANARQAAQATGRQWFTGEDAAKARAVERLRETIRRATNVGRRKRGQSPIEDGRVIELPSESSARKTRELCLLADRQEMARRESIERGHAADRRNLASSPVNRPVRIVDTPAPKIGAFRMRDI